MTAPPRANPACPDRAAPAGRRRLLLAAALLAAAALPAPALAEPERAAPERVSLMLCGDSLAQGLFLTLNPTLRRRDTVRITNGTQHATGLTRGDEHDWPVVTRDLVARHQPHLVVFWIGANDFRPMVVREQRSRFGFGTPGFTEHYTRRVGEMVTAVVGTGGRAVWLGLPNMRDAQFAGAARSLNEMQQAAATAAGAVFVPTWQATSDAQGRYIATVDQDRGPRSLRAEDGVHFTDLGYRRIASLAFDTAAGSFPELATGLGRIGEA
jgi:hypothetical protein